MLLFLQHLLLFLFLIFQGICVLDVFLFGFRVLPVFFLSGVSGFVLTRVFYSLQMFLKKF